jgi:Domain of unknown function (DUF4160)
VERRRTSLPRISEFFGIVIYMYWLDEQKHKMPHFHARFAGDEAVFDLTGKCLGGNLGPRAERLIREWCSERQAELQEAWQAAATGKEIPWITPLR